jgi:hypothetical protein
MSSNPKSTNCCRLGFDIVLAVLLQTSFRASVICDMLVIYINNPYTVLIPNLTYLPRATFLPLNCIADGSLALLTLKNSEIKLTVDDLAFYSTKKFQQFYRVARNFGTRSLNIDNNSVFFFGLQKEKKIK